MQYVDHNRGAVAHSQAIDTDIDAQTPQGNKTNQTKPNQNKTKQNKPKSKSKSKHNHRQREPFLSVSIS
jgi:hypothetical protein